MSPAIVISKPNRSASACFCSPPGPFGCGTAASARGSRRAGDGAGPFLISQGLSDAVVVGAARVAANGDVANKIGTYGLALAAHRAGIPFLVAVPESTIDEATPTGAAIPIELRADSEITVPAAPAGTKALNYAFDVTPAELVSAVVTEKRLIPNGQWLNVPVR